MTPDRLTCGALVDDLLAQVAEGRDERTAHRFLLVQLLGFGLNQVFIWVLTGPLLHGPTWWPLVPAVFVTPLVTFGLQRNWVYR